MLRRIYHPQTLEELEAIRRPYRGNVTIRHARAADTVDPGSFGYMIGSLDGAEERPARPLAWRAHELQESTGRMR